MRVLILAVATAGLLSACATRQDEMAYTGQPAYTATPAPAPAEPAYQPPPPPAAPAPAPAAPTGYVGDRG